ncbi:MAG TPA: CoA-binding protein [Burkholderiales bacterium]|nr:CoA-binding protein [Burkholderiales bacterium]
MPFSNPEPEQIKALLRSVKTIAVVGFSPKPGRASHAVARQMQRFGFRIIPVRPGISEGLGEKAYPDLASVPERIDIADVFRSGKYIPDIVDQCLRLGIAKLWLQEGAEHEASAERALAAGMTVVMGRCIMRDYARLCLG